MIDCLFPIHHAASKRSIEFVFDPGCFSIRERSVFVSDVGKGAFGITRRQLHQYGNNHFARSHSNKFNAEISGSCNVTYHVVVKPEGA